MRGDFRSIRRLMTDRPHTFTVRSSNDRRLAAALLGDPSVFGAELYDGVLSVRTSDFGAFTRSVPRVSRDLAAFLNRPAPEGFRPERPSLLSRRDARCVLSSTIDPLSR